MVQYKFDPLAFLTAISTGGLTVVFAMGGTKWVLVGAAVMAMATVIRTSLVAAQTGADAPAKSLSIKNRGDSVPVYNGEGYAVGQVETKPPGTVTTPAATATGVSPV